MYKNRTTHKERGSAGGGGLAPMTVFLLILAGFWVLWYFTGGPERAAQEGDKPFMKPIAPLDSGEPYNAIGH